MGKAARISVVEQRVQDRNVARIEATGELVAHALHRAADHRPRRLVSGGSPSRSAQAETDHVQASTAMSSTGADGTEPSRPSTLASNHPVP